MSRSCILLFSFFAFSFSALASRPAPFIGGLVQCNTISEDFISYGDVGLLSRMHQGIGDNSRRDGSETS
jgi:hypothetical protein